MKHLLFIYLFSIPILTFSQSKSEVRDYIIESKVFNEKRTISVFLPNAYNTGDSTKKFPVAYLFDGQFQPYFLMVNSIMSYYEQTQQGIPMIIVSIHAKNRWDEFVPICDGQVIKSVEGADKLTLFLSNEVIPLIDSIYRTNNFKIGIGHSLGGTYVINEVLTQLATLSP